MTLTPTVSLGKTIENITSDQIHQICRNIQDKFIQIKTSEEDEYYKLFFKKSDDRSENKVDIIDKILSIDGNNLRLNITKDINVEEEYPEVLEYFYSLERFKLFFNDIGKIHSKIAINSNYRIFSEVSAINNKFDLQRSYYKNYLEQKDLSVLICVDIIRQLYNQPEMNLPFIIKERDFSLFKSLMETNYKISDFLNSKRYNSTEKKNFGLLININTKRVETLNNTILQTNNFKVYHSFKEFHFLETLNHLFEMLKER